MQPVWEWLGVALVVVAAFILGAFGFSAHYAGATPPRNPLDIAYLTFQLFVLESGGVALPIPWQLEAARVLAPTVAAFATLNALAVLFRDELERFRIRLLRDHVVVCGLGRKGTVTCAHACSSTVRTSTSAQSPSASPGTSQPQAAVSACARRRSRRPAPRRARGSRAAAP